MSQEPVDAIAIRVALVDNDVDLREGVFMPGLLDHGFEVTGMGSAGELYRRMLTESFDIVVLDIGLPDENGFEVAKHLRATTSAGIVMLTGRSNAPDRMRGLTSEADVYLEKPVEVKLLAAALGSLAWRMTANGSSLPRDFVWRLVGKGWQLLAPNGSIVDLTLPERSVLQVLSDAVGHPIARETLISELTDDEYNFDPHRLEMVVYRLRRKVIQATGMELPLRAVRGHGYVLTPDQRQRRKKRGRGRTC